MPAAATGGARPSLVFRALRLSSKYTMSDPTPPISYTFEVPARPPVYIVAPRPQRPYWLHILLLLITLATTLTVGARLEYNFQHKLPAFSPWILGGFGVLVFGMVAMGGGSARRYGR